VKPLGPSPAKPLPSRYDTPRRHAPNTRRSRAVVSMAAAAATARRPWRRTGLSGAAAAALGVIVFVACVASSSCGSTSAASAERQPDLRSGSDPHPGSAPAPHRLRSTRSTTHPAAGGGPHPRGTSRPGLLLPSCEAVVEKVEHETLELLRDAAQAHSQALRDKTTYRYLRQHKMHPPEDQYEREAFSTELSLEELERRVDEAQGALVAIESKISTVAGKLRAEGKLPDALTDTVLRACAGGRLNPRAFESRPRVSIMLQYWQRPHNIRKFIERFGACNTPEVPLELLVNIDNPEDHELWANASWDTKGMVVPVFSYNVHEIRAYNRLASMARGDYLFLVGDDDLPFQDTKTGQVDCSWLHNSVKIMDRWPHIGVLGVRNYVTCYDLQYQKYDDSNRGEWFKDPLLNLTLQWVQWVRCAGFNGCAAIIFNGCAAMCPMGALRLFQWVRCNCSSECPPASNTLFCGGWIRAADSKVQ